MKIDPLFFIYLGVFTTNVFLLYHFTRNRDKEEAILWISLSIFVILISVYELCQYSVVIELLNGQE